MLAPYGVLQPILQTITGRWEFSTQLQKYSLQRTWISPLLSVLRLQGHWMHRNHSTWLQDYGEKPCNTKCVSWTCLSLMETLMLETPCIQKQVHTQLEHRWSICMCCSKHNIMYDRHLEVQMQLQCLRVLVGKMVRDFAPRPVGRGQGEMVLN